MITEQQVEKALDFIRDNAGPLAEAKANRIYLEEFRKSKKALLVNNVSGTVQERDSYAYSHQEYIDLLEALKAAVEAEERLKWLMVAAQVKTEVFRTQQANNRFIDRAHQ